MKKLALLFVASLLLAQLLTAFPTQAATPFNSPAVPAQTYTFNISLPTDLYVWVPCALGGQGETLYLTGDLHILTHLTLSASGAYRYDSQYQPQGMNGVGLTSGTKYQATGLTRDSGNGGALPYAFTYINNFRMIGQGAGSNYLVHENIHVTVNPNGELTAYVDNYSVDCK